MPTMALSSHLQVNNMFDEQQPTPLTPPKKVKFICSYGGFFKQGVHGSTRYQGGDHKLVSIRRDISYAELVHRFTEEYDKDISIKYMLPGETEQLVSVTTEEDLKNMLEEHDDLQAVKGRNDRLHVYLFPSAATADAVFEYDFPVRVESADSFETIRQEEVFPQESIFCEQDVDVEYEKVLVEQEQAHIQELRSQIAQLHDDPFHKDGDAVDGTERSLSDDSCWNPESTPFNPGCLVGEPPLGSWTKPWDFPGSKIGTSSGPSTGPAVGSSWWAERRLNIVQQADPGTAWNNPKNLIWGAPEEPHVTQTDQALGLASIQQSLPEEPKSTQLAETGLKSPPYPIPASDRSRSSSAEKPALPQMSFGLPESLSSNTASFEEGFGFFASEQSEGVSNWEEAWKRALANDADPPNVGDMINAMRESSPQEAVKPSHTKSAEKTILRVPSKQEIIDSLPASLSSSTSSILQEATTAIYQQPACWKIGEQGWASAASAQLVESVAAAVLSLHTLGSIPEAMVDTEGLPPTPKRELQHLPHKDINFETLLGSGTYSEVYRGSWRGSEVAIKLLRPPADVQTDKGAVRNAFLDESRLLSQLMHPNVVTLYGAIDDGRSMAVITEYMPSGSLRSALLDPERRRLGLAGRLKLALDVAHGMEYLHSQRPPVIHFDLKCDNLLCNLKDPDRPICKVGDLGLSREKSGQYVSGRMRGTLPWMAPELFPSSVSTRADQVTEKVDVFSFGVVMWEMWTGREPHAGVAFSDFLQGIMHEGLRPQIPVGCHPAWQNLMESCWQTSPHMRPTFSQITATIERLMRDPAIASNMTEISCSPCI
ncbi:hypothetical protein CYMTET_7689 [Cymbomonas tetramitiformis]|uniref:Protein kinase domain-containing protein n=1 Tax=Cymbomonas tetramitiformis TaxID=36881 RepID=A0AAE0GUN3_9CHLO|nr:hypothetical protein CYMTET_7689 [Cymbomonas tetramitiformis]